ncbi:MAG: pilus assembly protein TadG-related protein [Chloroflexota bacterium]
MLLRNLLKGRTRGQAMIIFALAIPVVFGMMALVVDVGLMYTTRRNLQNVADQAALVGAQCINVGICDAVVDATANVYANGLTDAEIVRIVVPPVEGNHIGDSAFIEVVVHEPAPLIFAGVIGQEATTVSGRAVARGYSGSGYGAIIALSPKKSPPSLKIEGTSDTYIEGGIWSNGEIQVNANSAVRVVTGQIAAVDGLQPADTECPILDGDGACATAWDDRDASKPPVTDDPLASVPEPVVTTTGGCGDEGGWVVCRPGIYTGNLNISAGEKVKFLTGIYWMEGNVTINGTAVGVESSATGVDPLNLDACESTSSCKWGPVSFFINGTNNKFEIQSQAKVRFQASPEVWQNILIWKKGLDPEIYNDDYKGAINIAGGSDTRLTGTIYAPESTVSIAGNGSVPVLVGQVVAGRISIGGTAATNIVYSADAVPALQPPKLVE